MGEALTCDERRRVARMLRGYARHQRSIAREISKAAPGDAWGSLMNEDDAEDAEKLADKISMVPNATGG